MPHATLFCISTFRIIAGKLMTAVVSVIIPSYNRWPLICRAIDSVLAQTVKPAEIIVVDDGSSDSTTANLHSKYGDQIGVLEQENRGVSAARNLGLAHSSGNWIALLDSDDEWLPEKLEQQLSAIALNNDCVLCHTDEIWIRNGVRVNPMLKHTKAGGDIFETCLSLCAISPSSVLIKKQLFNTLGTFDESLPACEDYDLWLRICSRYPVHFVNQKLLIKYGGHEDQLSKLHWGMDRFRIKALQKLADNSNLDSKKRQLTLNMIKTKTHILMQGAQKRANNDLLQECRSVLKKYHLAEPEHIGC